MDRRERYVNIYSYIQAMINSSLAQCWVSLPGIVQSFNAVDDTVAVQPAILMQSRDKNDNWKDITPSPVIPKAIVQFPGNHDFLFTFPLKAGDEGLIVFCDRCIDAWWQSGGIQSQLDIRQHDLTDCIFIPGIKSQGQIPAGMNLLSAELRTFSGNTRITFDDSNGITLTGNVAINGALTVTGGIQAGHGGADSVTVQNHVHPSIG